MYNEYQLVEQLLNLSKNNLFLLSAGCLGMYLFIMIGSGYNLSEGLVYYDDFQALLDSEISIVHTIFTTIFRTIMPIYLFPVLYYVNKKFFHKWSFTLFFICMSSFFLILNNIIIYGVGVYVFIAMKNLASGVLSTVTHGDVDGHYQAIYDLIQMVLNEVINAIYKPVLEIVRGASLILVLKDFKFNSKFLWLGAFLLIFDLFVVFIQYLSFLDFEFIILADTNLTDYYMVAFQYWVLAGFSILLFGERKRLKALGLPY